ncbi:MAG: DUF4157 domain-containing protein [Burkholderiales bacterium]|nr:MAG: DUF4157 domain-containing protein [Burkholderiales bacterium]
MKQTASPEQRTLTLPHPGGRLLQRKCACGGTCPSCKEKKQMQRSASSAAFTSISPLVDGVLRSPGQALDTDNRSFFEHSYGTDLSQVRVHNDAHAAASARAVNAQAYAVGQHIVFGDGRYQPSSASGRSLLAHELAHVAQQRPGMSAIGDIEVGAVDSAAEADADRMASDAMAGRQTSSALSAPAPTLARAPAPPKPCPATHTIADDVYKGIETAWAASNHGGDTVTEQGGRIVTDKDGKRQIRTGSGGGGSISLPAEQAGDTTLGTFHTHPYSKSEGSTAGVSFSGDDINNFIAGGQGNVKYIGAGTCIFALDTIDSTARDGCKSEDIRKRWNDAFAAAGGTFQAKVKTAVKAAIVGCGLCHYEACRPDEKTAIPKTASLL